MRYHTIIETFEQVYLAKPGKTRVVKSGRQKNLKYLYFTA